jgi:hypothetical protein
LSVSLEQLLYEAVIGNAAIVSLLSTDGGGNPAFYLIQLPQQGNVYPAGVYQRVSSPRLFVLQQVGNQASVGRARFQFTFWGYDAGVLEQIDIALLAMFRTFDAYNAAGSPPTVIQPGFYSYSSRLLTEPQTQPVLQKLLVDVIFWFQDQ